MRSPTATATLSTDRAPVAVTVSRCSVAEYVPARLAVEASRTGGQPEPCARLLPSSPTCWYGAERDIARFCMSHTFLFLLRRVDALESVKAPDVGCLHASGSPLVGDDLIFNTLILVEREQPVEQCRAV